MKRTRKRALRSRDCKRGLLSRRSMTAGENGMAFAGVKDRRYIAYFS